VHRHLNIAAWPLPYYRDGDIAAIDWSDADFVFMSSSCFSDATVVSLFNKALDLKQGAKLVSLKLPSEEDPFFGGQFELSLKTFVKMSWGRSPAYVLVRK
jgi:hypothetical protein